MQQYDYTIPIIVSGLFLILLLIFYLYKHDNKYIMRILCSLYNHEPAKIEKDTRLNDWIIFIILIVVVIIMGIKLVTFVVVISDSMKPEFQRGDMVLTQAFFLTPEPNDIITFNVEDRNTAVSHRFVKIDDDGRIITKGDAYNRYDNFKTYQKDIIAKAIQINGHPIVIKGFGALFITDYSKTGVIYKWGDRFTFMQQLSATIKAWGFLITVVSLFAYVLMMKKRR